MNSIVREIPFARPVIGAEEKEAVMKVMDGPILVHGPKAHEFEKDFARFTGAKNAVTVSSCTAGLHLCYFYLGLGPGDEVIVPAQTHVATAHAVELCGAKPVFVDAESKTGNIDIDQIEAAITPRTKALSIVHYLGMPVAMDRVTAIAQKYGLFVVEDCALAIGTYYKGIHAGLWGDAGCFSFYPVKHMTTAEGGMILTQRDEFALKVARQKAFGVDRNMTERSVPGVYDVTMLGFNYRMNEIQSVIGIEQVKRMPFFLTQREKNYNTLRKALGALPELSFFDSTGGDFKSSYYCLSVMLSPAASAKRIEIVEGLKRRGVGTSVYYPRPVPHFKYYREKYGYDGSEYPAASRISSGTIALPVGPHLKEEDMVYVADSIKETIKEVKI